jgi:hypothetical protein
MDGQRPAWLVASDRISIISHSQIIPSEYLPTFCSSVIESFLHKIPDLSENFVYCNDDCIFWDRATSDVFFTPSKPKVYLNKGNSQDGAIHSSDSGHIAGIKNANALLNSKFGHRSRREIFHFPQSFTKSACRLAWDLFSCELQQSAKSKFRSSRNIAFTNSLVPHLMLESGLAEWQDNHGIGLNIGFRSFRFMNLLVSILKFGGVTSEERALAVLKDDSKLKFIVLDGDKITVKKILNKRFPTPSIFERSK